MKRILALALVFACILSLSGCGKVSPKEPNDAILPDGIPAAEDDEHLYPLRNEETFDISVSYANYADIIGGLNINMMQISSVRHFPIWKFDTLRELEQFKLSNDQLTFDSGYDEIPSFNDAAAKYDEVFFEENSLILVYVSACSGTYRYGVSSVYCDGSSFCVHVEQTNYPEMVTDDMAGWFITVAVPDSMIENCTVFDADFNIGISSD